MSDSLAIYLNDHLAGSNFAVELLESLRDRYRDKELGSFAESLLSDIKQDQQVLQNIIEQVGTSHLDLKQVTGWLAEKASRLKLGHDDPGGLGTFEALETLEVGIYGKQALWRVLAIVVEMDSRVPRNNFAQLAAQAQGQIVRVEEQRMQVAQSAFATNNK
jgi:hypothetical protein